MNITQIRQALEQIPLPYLTTDSSFRILWSNPCLQKQYLYLSTLRSLEALLFGYDSEELLQQLKKTETPLTLACKLPLVSLVMSISVLSYDEDGEISELLVAFTGPVMEKGKDPLLASFNESLRQPVDGLFATIAYLRHQLDERYSHELQSMTKGCYQMLRSCIYISEYSELLHSSKAFELQYQDLRQWLHQQLDPALQSLQRMGIQLDFDLPAEPVILPFDGEKLSIALFALISNACLFCEEGRNSIRIAVSQDEQSVRLLVSDKGYGIPAQNLARVMEPYFSQRLDDAIRPGIGLGLPLCKMIVERHGGSMLLQSQQDRGTTVALTLPRSITPSTDGTMTLHAPKTSYVPERYPRWTVHLSTVLPTDEFQA